MKEKIFGNLMNSSSIALNDEGTKDGQILITCSHVCIIRGKPITARNACQAVKCYPRPRSQVD